MSVKIACVIGAGTIGSSWASLFIANDIRTIVYDVDPSTELSVSAFMTSALSTLQQLSRYSSTESLESFSASKMSLLSFTTDLALAVQSADIIQENTPESLAMKIRLLQSIEKHLKPSALLLSSTSTLTPSSMLLGLTTSAPNFLVGHPFNPPHLIPLVEIVPSPLTSPDSLKRAIAFYESLGKQPVHIRKEIDGHIANRIQAAVIREVLYLLQEGVASVEDIDRAIYAGPGVRWGILGPSALLHMGGGRGGAKKFAEKLFPVLLSITEQGRLRADKELVDRWVAGTLETVGREDGVKRKGLLEDRRDKLLVELLNIRDRK